MKSLRHHPLDETTDSRDEGIRREEEDDDDDIKVKQLIPPALAVLVYCNSLGGDFVHDDLSAVTTNPDVTGRLDGTAGSNWDFLRNDFWGTSLMDPASHKSYRPLTILTFRWNYAWSGLKPWSYHAVNVILHATVCWLLGWLCRRCFRLSSTTSLLTASLFALHPIHTEAVSGIVGRADILATLFSLLSFISHDRATAGQYSSSSSSSSSSASSSSSSAFTLFLLRASSLVAALLALLAKENGIAALPVAMAWDIIRMNSKMIKSGRKWWIRSCRVFLSKPVFLSLFTTMMLLAGRISLQQGQLPLFSEQDNPAAFASDRISRTLTLLYLPAFNMGLLLAPVVLSYDWQNGSIPLLQGWTDWRNLCSILFYASMVSAVFYAWISRNKVVLWSAAVMVLPMLPALNLFYPCGFVVAERLLYLPSVGYCVIIAVGLERILRSYRHRRRRRRSRLVLLALLFVGLAVKTWTRNGDWTDRRTLFESGLRSLPHNAKMHYNYANVQKDDGRWKEAIRHYRKAIKLWPEYASALNNLGTVLLAQAEDELMATDRDRNVFRKLDSGLVREAESRFRQAIRSHPHHVHAHYNLAVLHSQRNETEAAVGLLRRCLQLAPAHREALELIRRIGHSKAAEGSDAVGRKDVSHPPQHGSSLVSQSHPASNGWINAAAADRLPRSAEQPHRPSRGAPSNNYRWNKTA